MHENKAGHDMRAALPDAGRRLIRPPASGNLNALLQENLPAQSIAFLRDAGKIAAQSGTEAYAVGGFVRDLLLRRKNLDVDIMVAGKGMAYARLLAKAYAGKITTYAQFGTARITLPDGFKIDIAAARSEYYARPAALPQVNAADIRQDLLRRDFSINAMAVRLNPGDFGQLVDYNTGMVDLRAKRIRVLHALSFQDDPTRIFRAVRFEQRFDFKISAESQRYLLKALKLGVIKDVSRQRILNELLMILAEEQPFKAMYRLERLGVLRQIHHGLPGLKHARRWFADIRRVCVFAAQHGGDPVQKSAVYLMAWLDPLSLAETQEVLPVLPLPRPMLEKLLFYKQNRRRIMAGLDRLASAKVSRLVGLLQGVSMEGMLAMMSNAPASRAAKFIREYIARHRQVHTSLTGSDLKKLGYPPSPAFGKMLKMLLAARLDGEIVSRQDEYDFLSRKFGLPASAKSMRSDRS